MNDIIWRAVKRAQIPAVKEPAGVLERDGKREFNTLSHREIVVLGHHSSGYLCWVSQELSRVGQLSRQL